MIVTFCGDADAPREVYADLRKTLVYLIEYREATIFFVESEGSFYKLAQEVLEELCAKYAHIRYRVAMPPLHAGEEEQSAHLQKVILASDTVITYVSHVGAASGCKRIALENAKNVIELAK